MFAAQQFTNPATHAVLNRQARRAKAAKIAEIVSGAMIVEGARVLDVGTGGGYMAEYFSELAGPQGHVVGADIVKQLPADSTIDFRLLDTTTLPFPDGSFDLVISNHIVAQVGNRAAQTHHIEEMARVLRPAGLIYLSAHSRWALMEPGFGIPLLGWFPQRIRTSLVRLSGRGREYDFSPISRRAIAALAGQAGLAATDVSGQLLRISALAEIPAFAGKLVAALPRSLLNALAKLPIVPAFAFLLQRRAAL